MKIFISWSGERSEAMAKALYEWLPLVLHFVSPWLSGSDIQPGERWSVEVAKKLGEINFGILCITRENMGSPWILFEAGALAKSMQEGRVIPLLLDLDFQDISGPLAQFQAKKAENSGVRELVSSLNKAANNPVPDHNLDKLFSMAWADLEQKLTSIPKKINEIRQTRQQGEVLEELVATVRNVEMRVRDVMDDDISTRRRRKVKIPLMMFVDIMHMIADGPRDPIILLIAASAIRDDVPWVYELAFETYRSIKKGQMDDARRLHQKFLVALDFLRSNPFSDEYGGERKEMYYYIRDLVGLGGLFDSINPSDHNAIIGKSAHNRNRADEIKKA